MKFIDQLFGWILVALGVVYCAFTFRSHGFVSLSAYSTGVLIALVGLVNVLRAQLGKSGGLFRFTSSFASLFILALGIANTFHMRSVLRQNPQVPILVFAAFVAAIFSLRG